jgi:4-amino-4-deoxy-L-arabinose transferase-like glycosyltransferase
LSNTPPPKHQTADYHLIVVVMAVAAAVRLATLAMYPLMDTTEARYAEIARRMADLGDWVTPWIANAVPFWGKPPLSFWITAASFKFFGAGAFAARLPHWICGGLLAWVTWSWTQRRSRHEAICTLALIVGSGLFFAAAGAVMTDMFFALGVAMTMRGFWLALHGTAEERRREQYLCFFSGIAVGLLAKGPLTLVLAGIPIAAWTLTTGLARRVMAEIQWGRGMLLVAAIVLPWYWLAELRTPGFLEYFVVGEHWQRFTVPSWEGDLYGHAHEFARGTIWLFAALATLPWSLLIPAAAWRWRRLARPASREDRPLINYLLLWGLTPCVLFTLSRNILWTYVMPALPALAMLASIWLARLPVEKVEKRLLPVGVALTAVVGLGIVIAFNALDMDTETSTQSLIADYRARRSGDEALAFFGKRPLSGSFYSQGQAELAATADDLRTRLDQRPIYIAVKLNHLARMPSEMLPRLQPVSRSGDYLLYFSAPNRREGLAVRTPLPLNR